MDNSLILVLEQGEVLEFDKPSNLLKNPEGALRKMVDKASNTEELEALAAGKE